ncbi:hypothetical protein C8J57DRAFT_1541616 [Mycena rebaudengoi]|nr:hypothetical protein C8J57DRAFT_1541616 [Mycena rebaudengoi]
MLPRRMRYIPLTGHFYVSLLFHLAGVSFCADAVVLMLPCYGFEEYPRYPASEEPGPAGYRFGAEMTSNTKRIALEVALFVAGQAALFYTVKWALDEFLPEKKKELDEYERTVANEVIHPDDITTKFSDIGLLSGPDLRASPSARANVGEMERAALHFIPSRIIYFSETGSAAPLRMHYALTCCVSEGTRMGIFIVGNIHVASSPAS